MLEIIQGLQITGLDLMLGTLAAATIAPMAADIWGRRC